ncbi:acyl-CoA reductase [Dokdonia pacifica]|uniref:Acyl-CoA reductase (LuxC) n=1 Tax=Dokdonia pacifica TaxID=1627892 RepID=A0A239AWU6_9FLAO|nr:acyl-CoA reductase [Dokdonia pacifica]GGG32202.1 acyl-CoA reductase [Dokdonia pacifica]SNR99979.1 Acyl-CoA reductase (LuxC) [Dokdonia pacifica]
MKLLERINAFVQLGDFLSQFSRAEISQKEGVAYNDLFFDGFQHQIKLASEHNGWFTKENILYAIEGWASSLTEKHLSEWLTPYESAFAKAYTSKTIAVIMAGNIPLVGFHDFLSVLITAHQVIVKQSSNDKHLLPFLAKYLEYIHPDLKGKITFTEDKLPPHDAVIATGSDNTARYFEYYFGKKPNIIRKNRNSVAVLTGNETPEQLEALAEDIFRYYGLGCRNVSKLYVPKDYNFDGFFNAIYAWKDIINQAKYANNYDYNKAVYLMSLFDLLENGFLMLKEDASFGSPIATLFYERYESLEILYKTLEDHKDNIQCIVGETLDIETIAFGQTQNPQLHDYADGVDTIAFLLKK